MYHEQNTRDGFTGFFPIVRSEHAYDSNTAHSYTKTHTHTCIGLQAVLATARDSN